jgi:hypothetical protein
MVHLLFLTSDGLQDLGYVVDGRDFLFVLIFAPVQIAFSIIFLYKILGWRSVFLPSVQERLLMWTMGANSAVIGMTVMVVSFPIPGKIAHLVNNVQIERMKKVSLSLVWICGGVLIWW